LSKRNKTESLVEISSGSLRGVETAAHVLIIIIKIEAGSSMHVLIFYLVFPCSSKCVLNRYRIVVTRLLIDWRI